MTLAQSAVLPAEAHDTEASSAAREGLAFAGSAGSMPCPQPAATDHDGYAQAKATSTATTTATKRRTLRTCRARIKRRER